MIKKSLSWLAVAAGVSAAAMGAWAVSAPVSDWKIAGPFGGSAISVAVDPESPKTVLAGARSSLLYQSQDFGASWSPLNLPRRTLADVTSILVDPADSNHYLVGVLDAFGGTLYVSLDAGKTWSPNKDISDFGVRALAASPSNPSEFVAGTLKGVMMSADGGKSWSRISDPNNLEMQGITSLAIDPKDGNIIYAGTSHLPWKTMDGGKTWESIHSGMIDDSDVFSIYVSPAQPTDIFASACSGIYSSANRGDSWRKLAGIPNTSRRTHVIRQDLLQPNTIYAGTTTGLFKSANSGVNWKTVSNTQVNSIAFDPAQPKSMYLAMEDEGMGKTDDGGETIKASNNGFVDRQIAAVTTAGDKFVAIESQVGGGTGIFVSPDKGETWNQIRDAKGLAGVHLRFLAGSSTDAKVLLAGTSRQIFSSADGGSLWKPLILRMIVPPPPPPPAAKTPARSAAATKSKTTTHSRAAAVTARRPVKPRVILRTITPTDIAGLYSFRQGGKDLLYMAINLGLFRSSDGGSQWTQLTLNAGGTVSGLYSSGADADTRLVARGPAGLLLSKDSGDQWEPIAFPLPVGDVNDVALPADPKSRLLIATRVGLYSSPDGGGNWAVNAQGIQASTVSAVIYGGSAQTAYAVEYGHLFQSNDAGVSWSPAPTALPSLQIRQLWVPNSACDRLYGITSGLGILFRN